MKFLKFVAGALASLAIATSGSAAVVYENGSLNGNFLGESVGTAQAISNSFSLSGTSHLTGATVGLWVTAQSTPALLTWSIGSSAFGGDLASGTTALANAFAFNNNAYDIYLSSFAVDLTLGAGDYWLTLTDGMSSAGQALFWDVNDGPSQAQYRNAAASGSLPFSEYFLVSGNDATDPGPGPNPVPEPASMVLLAVGMIGFAAARRRYLKPA